MARVCLVRDCGGRLRFIGAGDSPQSEAVLVSRCRRCGTIHTDTVHQGPLGVTTRTVRTKTEEGKR